MSVIHPGTENEINTEDIWNPSFKLEGPPWKELPRFKKNIKISLGLLKLCIIIGSLYFFIASLSFMADGFRLLAGKQTSEVFRNYAIFNNPVAGLMVGVLVTVLVQSSSTSTSIVITMVAAELLTVDQSIPIIMGANIGTSVTSTIVALGQANKKNEFRRAFAAATVHDMFNFISVIVFLPLEAATNFLTILSHSLVKTYGTFVSTKKPPDMLKVLTNPLTKRVIQLDKDIIKKMATEKNTTKLAILQHKSLIKVITQKDIDSGKKYGHLFNKTPLTDNEVGTILVVSSLTILCIALYIIVKTLKSLLGGHISTLIHRTVNGNIKNRECPIMCRGKKIIIPLEWISGYIAILVGVGVTIAVQSSSITTSALTPLVGVGVLSLERMYPVVLGANIGTCITGILAALAADGSKLIYTLQVAYAHLLFNICGITMLYVIYPMRQFPINTAKFLGNTTAKYRWFAIIYLFAMFLILPGSFVGLSLAGTIPLLTVTFAIILIGLIISVINIMQTRCKNRLPQKIQTWNFLPTWMRTLEPYDNMICKPIVQYMKRCPFKCCWNNTNV